MKKRFLTKITVVLFIFLFIFLLQWKITLAKTVCEINISKIYIENYASPKENIGHGFYPFADLIIKI